MAPSKAEQVALALAVKCGAAPFGDKIIIKLSELVKFYEAAFADGRKSANEAPQ